MEIKETDFHRKAKIECWNCKHCRKGFTAHKSCHHPVTEGLHGKGSMGLMAAVMGVRGNAAIAEVSKKLNIRADEHGIKNGWFNWPWDFSPTWLENCDGFKEK